MRATTEPSITKFKSSSLVQLLLYQRVFTSFLFLIPVHRHVLSITLFSTHWIFVCFIFWLFFSVVFETPRRPHSRSELVTWEAVCLNIWVPPSKNSLKTLLFKPCELCLHLMPLCDIPNQLKINSRQFMNNNEIAKWSVNSTMLVVKWPYHSNLKFINW